MKVLFLQDFGINESLALCDLSAYLKTQGHNCHVLIENNEKYFFKEIENLSPDIFIIPWDVGANFWINKLIKNLKNNFNKKIIVCGTYPTLDDSCIKNPYLDIVCQGETELAIAELLNKLEKKESPVNIKNIIYKENSEIYKNEIRPLIEDINILPLSDREIYFKRYTYLRNFSLKRFVSGRGCIHSCSFCFNKKFKEIFSNKGSYIRRKSVDKVLREISVMSLKYPLQTVHFSDDLFTVHKNWIIEFCKKYAENFSYPFTCNSRVDEIDEEIVYYLKKANCKGIAIGIESGVETLRSKILNKHYTNQQIIKTAKIIKKNKIMLTTFNMIAIPSETLSDAFKTIKLNSIIKPQNVRAQITIPIPYSSLTNEAIKEKLLPANFKFQSLRNLKPVFKSKFSREFLNLSFLFGLAVKYPALNKFFKLLIKLPLTKIYRFLIIFRFFNEKKFFSVGTLESTIFYFKAGSPLKRTKNFNNYLP